MRLKSFRTSMCIVFIQLSLVFGSYAEVESVNPIINPSMTITTTPEELEYLLDLSLRVMLDKDALYDFVNKQFENPEHPKQLLSQTKIVFILSHLEKSDWNLIEDYLKKYPGSFKPPGSNRITAKRALLKKKLEAGFDPDVFMPIIDRVKSDPKAVEALKANVALSQPLLIKDRRGRNSFSKMSFTANHEMFEDPDKKKSKVIPATDQRQLMVDRVSSLEKGDRLLFNFYDFDMPELKDELIKAHKRGVDIAGGMDGNVYKDKEGARIVVKEMIDAGIKVELVDSVGLNHEKLMAGIRKNGASWALFGSGNATQSCNGPEGDLKGIPEIDRPEISKPNPNHILVVEGEYAARIVTSEINKNIVYGLRGKSGFPVGGAYLLNGRKQAKAQDNEKIILAFSPNGGMGDINRDIYTRLLNTVQGGLEGGIFSMSSAEIGKAMSDAIVREIKRRRSANKPTTGLLKMVADTQFAMRDFSVLLKVSGYNMIEFDPADPFKEPKPEPVVDPEVFDPNAEMPSRDVKKVKVFIDNPEEPLSKEIRSLLSAEEWAEFRSNIRVSPDWFKKQSVQWGGEVFENQVKLHYKALAIPELHISNPGSSINFSNGGLTNQEQIVLVLSKRITKLFRGALKYLREVWSSADRSIHKEAQRRNDRVSEANKALALEVFKFQKQAKERSSAGASCGRFYSKAN